MQDDSVPPAIGSNELKAACIAFEWLDDLRHSHPRIAHQCEERLRFLPSCTRVPGFGPAVLLHTNDLLRLLSNEWLNDDLLNAGLDWLMQQHVEATSRVRVVNCLLLLGLSNMRRRGSYAPRQHSSLDLLIRSGKLDHLYIPLHVDGNHWTLLGVDLRHATYVYADSRNTAAHPPAETMETLVWWLATLLPHFRGPPLTVVQPTWEVPVQEDSHSCGIIVLSTLSAILLGDPAWSQELADNHRMQWFLRLTEGSAEGDEEDSDEDVPMECDDDLHSPLLSVGDCNTLSHPIEDDSAPAVSDASFASMEVATLSLDPVDWIEYLDADGDTPPGESSAASTCARSPGLPTPTTSPTLLDVPCPSAMELSARPGKHALPPELPTRVEYAGDDDSEHTAAPSDSILRPSSWSYQKDLAARSDQPGFVVDEKKMETFKRKILALDAHATFDKRNPRRLRCSACATWIVVPLLYDVSAWRTHRKSKRCSRNRSTGLASTSLLAWYQPAPKQSMSHAVVSGGLPLAVDVPCPGLQRSQDERVARYLARTATGGGGAPSRTALACKLFQSHERSEEACAWGRLLPEERQMVLRSEATHFRWRNLRAVGAVYSTRCEESVKVPHVHALAKPCPKCSSLLHLAMFRTQLNREMPDESNMKYTPKLYRNKELGAIYLKYLGARQLLEEDGLTPWRKFGLGVAAGKFKDSRVMLGAIEAMQIKSGRVAQGKHLQNMKYTREFTDFANVLASISTRAYQTFRHHFGGPHVRTLQKLRARLPRFQPGVSPANVAHAASVLKQLDYSGPVVLAWDDTALEPAIAVWEDAATKTCSILGSTHGVIQVPSTKEFDDLFNKAKESKATKLRLYVLVVPLAKVPPILLAAVARGGKENSKELYGIHNELMQYLHSDDIYPVSFAADGTEVERVLQRKILAEADRFSRYDIPNDVPGCTIQLKIHLINGHPAVTVQDPKHALKTARNQLFTGARILVLGCLAFFYAQLVKTMPSGSLVRLSAQGLRRFTQRDRGSEGRFEGR